MKEKKLYRIYGVMPYVFGSKKQVNEYVHAYSESQALKLIAIRIQKRHPFLNIDLSECKIEEINKSPK